MSSISSRLSPLVRCAFARTALGRPAARTTRVVVVLPVVIPALLAGDAG